MKCSVFIATSLDGFIAREDGQIDWLDEANKAVPPGEDCGYSQFMSTIDALVLGRKSFETVMSFPEWPYGELPLFVLSSTMGELPAGTPETVQLLDGDPDVIVEALAEAGGEHLYIDGGTTIQRFLQAGLINEMTITTVPVLIGGGRRLFGPSAADVHLHVLGSRVYPFGFVQTTYQVMG